MTQADDRIAVARYAEEPDATRRIREELGVGALVTGSVRLAGTRARSASSWWIPELLRPIWSHQCDQTIADILQLQSDVARHCRRASDDADLSGAAEADQTEHESPPPTSCISRHRPFDLAAGHRHVERGGELDLKFACLCRALAHAGGVGAFGDRQLYTDALASARKAVEADPNEGRAHDALATMHLRMGNIAEARAGTCARWISCRLPEAARDLFVAESGAGRLDESLFGPGAARPAPNASMAHPCRVPLAMLADTEARQRWLRGAEERFPVPRGFIHARQRGGSLWQSPGRGRASSTCAGGRSEGRGTETVVAVYAFLTDASDAQARVEDYSSSHPTRAPSACP